ncbi:MAG TPA: NAD(P)H-dependent oxidoreductase, partial [Geminicoccaceae bacterium]|nr:NAD(P)H-dependent oxidoreductase [Geminicoccaceae bacterium]
MRLLVVHAHPVETSFNAAVHGAAVETLAAAGHEVRDLDLYAMGFDPVLGRQERIDYHEPALNTARIAEHVAHLRWAEGVILVYPTWWYGMPAILKGWIERVWVPGVAFTLGRGLVPIQRGLPNIRLLAGI